MSYKQHGWRHHPTKGTDPVPGFSAGGGIVPAALQPVPLAALYNGQFTDVSPAVTWGGITDSSAIGGMTFTNAVTSNNGSSRTPALNDYFTLPVTLGPKGSAWSIFATYKLQPNGGIFKITLASVPDTNGELADSPGSLTYLNPLALGGITYLDDTYQGVTSYDGGSFSFSQSLVIGGDDGAAFTAVTGTDANTGYPIIDGGSGVYRWKLQVTGKTGSSSGYRVDLMAVAWARVDASGYF